MVFTNNNVDCIQLDSRSKLHLGGRQTAPFYSRRRCLRPHSLFSSSRLQVISPSISIYLYPAYYNTFNRINNFFKTSINELVRFNCNHLIEVILMITYHDWSICRVQPSVISLELFN